MVQDSSNPFGYRIDWDTSGYTEIENSTAGDLPFWGTSGIPDILPIGSAGTFLGVSSGLPAWLTPANLTLLSQATVSNSTTNTVSFQSIASGYKFFLLTIEGDSNSSDNGVPGIFLNNDTTSGHYAALYNTYSSVSPTGGSSASTRFDISGGAGTTGERFGYFAFLTNSSTLWKTFASLGFTREAPGNIVFTSGTYNQTTEISRIDVSFHPDFGTRYFGNGTKITLYGAS